MAGQKQQEQSHIIAAAASPVCAPDMTDFLIKYLRLLSLSMDPCEAQKTIFKCSWVGGKFVSLRFQIF